MVLIYEEGVKSHMLYAIIVNFESLERAALMAKNFAIIPFFTLKKSFHSKALRSCDFAYVHH